MPLTARMRIGPYEIISPLGAGGMGEVYRARDTQLHRDVAIKILPDAFASDGDRVARFAREAQTLASLNHPHIAQIYGLEQSSTTSALVMELVEGEDLAERIARGAIAVDEALAIARQIAEALEAAHEQGIVHRDLKPANIKLRPDGTVKVLDFGLAKALDQGSGFGEHGSGHLANSPTMTSPAMTMRGLILGTAAYMAPEQARGKAVDQRADIWAFGCVLYEMLTGKTPFAGATMTDILAAIVHKTPDWDALPVNAPAALRRLIRRCLEKDRKRRLADIADARLEIDEALASAPEPVVTPAARPRTRVVLLSAFAALAIGFAAAFAGWSLRQAETGVSARFTIPLPPGDTLADARKPLLALSPDGRTLVYVAVRGGGQRLFRRQLDQFDAEPIPGTAGAYAPFFSPDSDWLGFFDAWGAKKMPVPAGAAIEIAFTGGPYASGAALMRDGALIYAPGLFSPVSYAPPSSTPAGGASNEPLANKSFTTAPMAAAAMAVYTGLEPIQHWPEALPDGKTVLVAEGGFDLTSWDDAQIVAQSIDGRSRKIVIQGGTHPRYLPTGHLLYVRAGSLMAVRFDAARLETIGTAVRVLEGVAQSISGAAQYAISNDGTLAYIDGPAQSNNHGLVWMDREGRTTPLTLPPNTYWSPSVSPDGRFIALSVLGPATDVWTYDIARETLTRLSIESQKTRSVTFSSPRWTPDSKRVVYEQVRDGRPAALFWRNADGSGVEERLAAGEGPQRPNCWLPDGKMLLFTETRANTKSDLWLLPIEGERTPRPFLQTAYDEFGAACAPDGNWIAYVSDESGSWEVYVRRVQGSGERIKISSGGGIAPVWTPDGQQLIYLSLQDDPLVFHSVPVTLGSAFRAGRPTALHQGRYYWEPAGNYDVAPDGRLLLMPSLRDPSIGSIRIIQRWFDELKRRVP